MLVRQKFQKLFEFFWKMFRKIFEKNVRKIFKKISTKFLKNFQDFFRKKKSEKFWKKNRNFFSQNRCKITFWRYIFFVRKVDFPDRNFSIIDFFFGILGFRADFFGGNIGFRFSAPLDSCVPRVSWTNSGHEKRRGSPTKQRKPRPWCNFGRESRRE